MDIPGGLGKSAGKVMFLSLFMVLKSHCMFSMSSSDQTVQLLFHCFENLYFKTTDMACWLDGSELHKG